MYVCGKSVLLEFNKQQKRIPLSKPLYPGTVIIISNHNENTESNAIFCPI